MWRTNPRWQRDQGWGDAPTGTKTDGGQIYGAVHGALRIFRRHGIRVWRTVRHPGVHIPSLNDSAIPAISDKRPRPTRAARQGDHRREPHKHHLFRTETRAIQLSVCSSRSPPTDDGGIVDVPPGRRAGHALEPRWCHADQRADSCGGHDDVELRACAGGDQASTPPGGHVGRYTIVGRSDVTQRPTARPNGNAQPVPALVQYMTMSM